MAQGSVQWVEAAVDIYAHLERHLAGFEVIANKN